MHQILGQEATRVIIFRLMKKYNAVQVHVFDDWLEKVQNEPES